MTPMGERGTSRLTAASQRSDARHQRPEMEATDGAKALFKLRFITRQFLCLSLKKVPYHPVPEMDNKGPSSVYTVEQSCAYSVSSDRYRAAVMVETNS